VQSQRATSQPTAQIFWRVQLQAAIDFAVRRMRGWSSGANGGAE